MKKGFTMVEILAVFTIMALILLITVPFVTGILKKSDESNYEEFENTVFIAAEAYIQEENIEIVKDTTNTIKIGDLVDSKYLKSTLINPNNEEKVMSETNRNIIIKVTLDEENILNFEIEVKE